MISGHYVSQPAMVSTPLLCTAPIDRRALAPDDIGMLRLLCLVLTTQLGGLVLCSHGVEQVVGAVYFKGVALSIRKLLATIRNNPKEFGLTMPAKLLNGLGLNRKAAKGSHRTFSRHGEKTALNFQNRNGRIAFYQARQLIAMMDKYDR